MTFVGKRNENVSRSKRNKIAKLFQKHIPLRTKKNWEDIYENNRHADKNDVRELLPTKIGNKLYRRFIKEESPTKIKVKKFKKRKNDIIIKERLTYLINLNSSDFFFNLSKICISVISSPIENIERISPLIKFLFTFPDQVERRNQIVDSLLQVFTDLIPGYRILPQNESAKKIQFKQETRTQQSFDSSFLLFYKKFINFLIKSIESQTGYESMLIVLGKLLIANPRFNYSEIIISFFVRVLTFEKERRELAKDFLIKLITDDDLGETTLTVVTEVSGFSKSSETFSIEMVQILLYVRIDEGLSMRALDDLKSVERKVNRLSMSRRERKENREFRILEKEMRHTEISENKERVAELQAQILEKMFYIFFRVLKNENVGGSLLSSILSGLSKFAKHINIEFVNDVLMRLKQMLNEMELTDSDRLNVVKTAFTISAGDDVVLSIEQNTFFRGLNESILSVGCGSDEDALLLIECLQIVINRCLGQVNVDNVEDILSRLMVTCLHSSPSIVLAYFSLARRLVMSGGRNMTARLLGADESVFSFTPTCGDPSNLDGVLWQMSLLRNHYHEDVRGCVDGMMSMASGKVVSLNFRKNDCSGSELIASFKDSESLIKNCEKTVKPKKAKWTGFVFNEFQRYYDNM